jgi:predicted outer membrane protein
VVANQHFAIEAAGGMAEVELGKMATTSGTSDDVKNYSERMIDDHLANDERPASGDQ